MFTDKEYAMKLRESLKEKSDSKKKDCFSAGS